MGYVTGGTGFRPPTNRGPPTKPFTFYFSLTVVVCTRPHKLHHQGQQKIFRTNTLTRHLSSFMLMFSVFDASVYTDRTNTKLHLKNWKDVWEQVSIMYVWMMFCRLLCFKNVVTVFCYSYYLRINDIMRQIGLLLFSQSQRWITVCHVYFRNRPHSVFETPWIAWMLKTRQWCVKIILGSAPCTAYTIHSSSLGVRPPSSWTQRNQYDAAGALSAHHDALTSLAATLSTCQHIANADVIHKRHKLRHL